MTAASRIVPFLLSTVLFSCLPLPALHAGWKVPPAALQEVIEAPGQTVTRLSPDRSRLLVLQLAGLEELAELAEPEERLGGIRFRLGNRAPTRQRPYIKGSMIALADRSAVALTGLPEDGRWVDCSFSPDGTRLAATVVFEDRTEVWGATVVDGRFERLTPRPLNRVHGSALAWTHDGTLIVRVAPTPATPPPPPTKVPDGPNVQENSGGRAAPAPTFQDLVQTNEDEARLAWALEAELIAISPDGTTRPLQESGLIVGFDVSPDGDWLLVERVELPFSRLVPLYRYASHTEVVSLRHGQRTTVARLPVGETIPLGRDARRAGRRMVDWRADSPATLYFIEALDGGDHRIPADERDAVSLWPAPFTEPPVELARVAGRINEVQWGRGDFAVLQEFWWQNRQVSTWRLRPDQVGVAPDLLFRYSSQDRYGFPGDFTQQRDPAGRLVLQFDALGRLLLTGPGASDAGDRPFLDRFDPATGERTRLFEAGDDVYEMPTVVIDPDRVTLLTSRESPAEPPNTFLRELDTGTLTAITTLPHPHPVTLRLTKIELDYQRSDGLPLTATLYLPPDYTAAQGPLPGLVWAYPREFKRAADAGQRTRSPNRFVRAAPTSPLLFALAGYAVLDNASMPIIGEGDDEPNDTFIAQLTANAEAVIAAGVARGVLDPDRVAVAGHSYGAFMTANLLAHTRLFRAGIGRSGAYNRSLTPFGFQNETRTFWEAPDVYLGMSPFAHANTIEAPLLLIHGEADNNTGTFPLQSERLYAAIKGHGRPSRLVMLPHESHGYVARENVLHTAAETLEWLERWVKPVTATAEPAAR